MRRNKAVIADEPDRDLLDHIQALGLGSVNEYREWCARNGFSRKLSKHWRFRMKERAFSSRVVADARLARKKQELKRPEAVIDQIFQGELSDRTVTQPQLDAICQFFKLNKYARHVRRNAHRLLLHVCKSTEFVNSDPVIADIGRQEGNSYVEALLAMAQFSHAWIRRVEDWRPRSHNTPRQFSSLAQHLFARWPVPTFMESVWFKGRGARADCQQRWFVHLGKGENIRTADLPIPYTKRMAHHFMQAPSNFSVEAALRWGQARAWGGDERLVRSITGNGLGLQFTDDEFWSTVWRWFVAHPMLDPTQIGPLIDYIYHHKFVSEDAFVGPGAREPQGPPQPNFTMRGRTPESLLRQVDAWHRQLAKSGRSPAEWKPAGIDELEYVEGNEQSGNLKVWTIKELLSTKALVAEGRKLKHCVATYSRSCAAGQCSIWTMEVDSFEGKRKILTVEVNNTSKVICQARGKCNALPGEKHRGILRRWTDQSGLRIASYV